MTHMIVATEQLQGKADANEMALVELEEKYRMALECIRFYGDRDNYSSDGEIYLYYNEGKESSLYQWDDFILDCGGKARKFLSDVEGEK